MRAGLALALLAGTAAAPAGDLIYANGFEAGLGNPDCISGSLGGDTLAAPSLSGATLIGCLEISNDAASREAAAAYGALPVPRALNLLDAELDRLVVIGPAGLRWPAQHVALSRWASPLSDTAAAIRWLQTDLSVDIAAGQSATLALLRLPMAVPALPAIEQLGSGERRTIDTGWIEVELDGAASQPIRRVRIREQLGGPLLDVFQAQAGSADEGWRVRIADASGSVLLEAAEDLPGSLIVDRVRWESAGATVSSLLHIDGHLEGPINLSRCNGDADWLRFPWSLSLRLTAGSADLAFDWQLGNACGSPQGPQTADSVEIALAEFRLPLLRGASGAQLLAASNGPLQLGPGPVSSRHQLLQRRGGGSPWQRRAELRVDGSPQNSADYFAEPGLGLARPLGSGQLLALLAQPWLRYREPQGLVLQGHHAAFQLIAERIRVGKAKSLWFSGRLALQAGVDGGKLVSRAQMLHQANLAALERPLLLRPTLASLDAAAILPPLAGDLDAPLGIAYQQYLQRKHDDTVGDEPCVDAGNDLGSQWTCARTFGLQLWPDVQFDAQFGYVDNPDPASNEGKLNYWDPAHIELVEFLRSGQPRWAHDFALPQARLMAHTAYYHFGPRRGSNIAGHSFGSGGNGDGLWHRSDSGSADYSYNRHQALAYVLNPSIAQRDRFAAAGHAAGLRFVDDPQDDTSWSAIGRLNLQYLESLANCAQFVPGEEGSQCDQRLRQVLGKLIDSSLTAGLMCEGKFAAGPDCFLGQTFMLQAWYYPILDRLYLNYGDSFPAAQRERWRRSLIETPARVLAELPTSGGGVDVDAPWPNGLQCQLGGADFSLVQSCSVVPDPDNLRQNKPALLSLLVRGHAWDPTRGLCAAARQISADLFAGTDPLGNLRDVIRGGWWKGAAEAGQELSTAALAVERCPQ